MATNDDKDIIMMDANTADTEQFAEVIPANCPSFMYLTMANLLSSTPYLTLASDLIAEEIRWNIL